MFGYIILVIASILTGIATGSEILVVAPLIPILVYLLSTRLISGIIMLLLFFPLSMLYEVSNPRIGLQLPTEPLIVAIVAFWFLFIIINIEEKEVLSTRYKWLRFTYLIYYLVIGASILISTHPFISAKAVLGSFLYSLTMIFVFISAVRDKQDIITCVKLFFVVVILVVLYTTIRHAATGFTHHGSNFAPRPFFNEHGTYGTVVAIAFALALPLLLTKKQNNPFSGIALLTAILSLTGVILSFARAAWVSVIALFIFYAIVMFRKFLNAKAILLILFLGLGTSYAVMTLEISEEIEQSVTLLVDVERDVSNLERINRWVAAINMFQAKPVLGLGFATYIQNYPDYRDLLYSTEMSDMYKHAHNEYLQHLAETGIMGLFAWLIFIISIYVVVLKTYNEMSEGWERNLLIGASGAMFTYFVHALFNGYLMLDKVAVPFWFCAGIIFYTIRYHKPPTQKQEITPETR